MVSSRRISIAWYLLPAYLALLIYASLYPFRDWNPAGFDVSWVINQRLPRIFWSEPDNFMNVLGYMPLGFLLALALIRSQERPSFGRVLACVAIAIAAASAWSWFMETCQLMMPRRDSNIRDWITNSLGGAIGAALAATLDRLGLLGHWHAWRSRWLAPHAQPEAALLVAWPFALITPTAVPFGLGQVAERLMLGLQQLGLPLGALIAAADTAHLSTLSPLATVLCGAWGVAVPAALGFLAVRTKPQRGMALLGLLFMGWFAISVSSALSFGPKHTWSWWSLSAQASVVLGVFAALACLWLRRRAIALVAALGLVWMLAVLNQASSSAYFWQTLQTWEQGRFIYFHGVAQWIGWLWPYLALAVLLRRAFARDKPAANAFGGESSMGRSSF